MCSRHKVEMVIRVHLVMYRDGCRPFEYWACPVPECDYVKPQKFQKHPVKRRTSRRKATAQIAKPANERQGSLFLGRYHDERV